MDLDEYRRLSHDIWEQMAPGWDGWNAMLAEAGRPVTDQMVTALEPQPGETILELAGGAGVSGFAAAALMGGEGRLIMTDFAEKMVEAQRRRGEELGFRNIDYRVMDAERMDLDDDSVDGVLCRWGYMLMADPAAALDETRRVLRDGGRLSFSVWGAPDDNQWATLTARILIERGHMEPAESGAPGIFAMADPGRIETLMTEAGFERPHLHEIPTMWTFESFDQFWQYTLEIVGAIALVIAQLDDREREAVRSETQSRFEDFAAHGRYEMPGVCINGLTR
jgi:ubiquinone/menaquinone biosynthesis C-methylase UbiE